MKALRATAAPAPWLLTTPLPALALGMFLMRAHGVPLAVLFLQACGAGVALVLAVLLLAAREALLSRPWALAAVALGLVAATFVFMPLEGVHRWLALGPLRLHPSAFVSPLALLAAGVWLYAGSAAPAVLLALALQTLHVLQPDAGQAASFGLGSVALFIGAPNPLPVRVAACLSVALLGAASCLRTDPLPAVAHVERALALAAADGPGVLLAAVGALMLPVLSLCAFARRGQSPLVRGVGAALALYLLGLALVPTFGNFPVPLLGFSPSMLMGVGVTLGLASALPRMPLSPGPPPAPTRAARCRPQSSPRPPRCSPARAAPGRGAGTARRP